MMNLNWPQRFAVIEHFKASDEQVCQALNISSEEYQAVRQMRAEGIFAQPDKMFDVTKHGDLFGAQRKQTSKPAQNATTHKRVVQRVQRANQPSVKRGRQSNKIATALKQVPDTPMLAEEFSKQHNISIAVLRQAKRFIEKMSTEEQNSIGTVFVRQDKQTKQLMIWRA